MTIDATAQRSGVRPAGLNPDPILDAWSLAVLTVPEGAGVLVVATDRAEAALCAGLANRGCTFEVHAPSSLTDFEDERRADVAIVDAFDRLDDPVAVLRTVADRLAPQGKVVIVADNAAYAAARIKALRGEPEENGDDLPPRRYDLVALERAIERAGLVVTDRLRAVCALGDAPGDPDPATLPPGLAALVNGPEAGTHRFVLVAESSAQATAASAPTVTEFLQTALNAAQAQLSDATAERTALQRTVDDLSGRLGVAEASLSAALTQTDEMRADVAAHKDALRERGEEINRLHAERRHLELDLAVRDDYVSELRARHQEVDVLMATVHHRAAELAYRLLLRLPRVHRVLSRGASRAVPILRRGRSLVQKP